MTTRHALAAVALVLGTSALATAARSEDPNAQPTPAGAPTMQAAVAEALDNSEELAAIRARIQAAEAKVRPAGALPDPMVSAGLQNIPVGQGVAIDKDMTMWRCSPHHWVMRATTS